MRPRESFATLPGTPLNNNRGAPVESEELLSKLELIEEQARLTLDEHPLHLTKERQRMIISLSKHIRWLLTDASDAEATLALPPRGRPS